MPLAFRELKNIAHWDTERGDEEEWLHKDEIRADAFKSLGTTENALSIFVIDNEDKLPRLLAAIAANRNKVQSIDFAVFDLKILDDNGIEHGDIEGTLPDKEVCSWHQDIVHLDGTKLHLLAKLIYKSSNLYRKLDKFVAQAIHQSISSKQIDPSKLNESIVKDLKQAKYQL